MPPFIDGQVDMEPQPSEFMPRRVAGLPLLIYDFSGAPAEHVDSLVRRALNGMGLSLKRDPRNAIESL